MWKFQHPEGQREINELHIPVNRPVKLVLASEDVGLADLHTLPIAALMTKTVITCSLSDNIALVASTMLSRNIRHLPVEEEKRCVGMVSIRDVLKSRLDELQQQAAQLRTFVNEMARAPQDRE
jgi:predicted transcriptional regulator